MQLTTAETFHAPPNDQNIAVPAWTLVLHSERFKHSGKLPDDRVADKPQVIVKVSAGRWCAECPWCPASEYPSITDHRFMCSQCHNNGSYVWIPTIWPDQTTTATIDAILMLRPIPGTRNWTPGETVNYLGMENELMGIRTLSLLGLTMPSQKEIRDVYGKLVVSGAISMASPEWLTHLSDAITSQEDA